MHNSSIRLKIRFCFPILFIALIKEGLSINTESTVKISTRRITSTTAKPEANDLALSKREIFVYSIGAGAFVLVILLCTVCQRRYKQIYVKFKRYQTAYRRNRNIPEMSLPNIPLEEIEGIYEVIDESNMIDTVGIIMEGNNLISDTNENYSQSTSNSYLTPCQPGDDVLNTNNLIDNKSECSSQSDAYHQGTSDRKSTSSNLQNNRSSYLNPYQPIVHSADIHEYLSIHDSGSSGSEILMKEANYLNPYQPMIQERNVHEYKSIYDCPDRSHATSSDTCAKEKGVKFPDIYQDDTSEIQACIHEYTSVN